MKNVIFDLDNTLFDTKSTSIWDQMTENAATFLSNEYGLSQELALEEIEEGFKVYGSSVIYLQEVYGSKKVEEFVNAIHRLNLIEIKKDQSLLNGLNSLDYTDKFIYTNGSYSYANEVLKRLGILNCFKDIFSIESSEYTPKPSKKSINMMLSKFNLKATRTVCVDDCGETLNIASQEGLKTIYIGSKSNVNPIHKKFKSVKIFFYHYKECS